MINSLAHKGANKGALRFGMPELHKMKMKAFSGSNDAKLFSD